MVVTVRNHASYLTFNISVFHPHGAWERPSYHLTTEVIIYPYSLIIIIQNHFTLQTMNSWTKEAHHHLHNKWTQSTSISSHNLFRIIFNNILQTIYVPCGFFKISDEITVRSIISIHARHMLHPTHFLDLKRPK